MNNNLFRFTALPPHPYLREIVVQYRIKEACLPSPILLPNFSPIFQGLIFNIKPLADIILKKKEESNLKHKVYFVGQAISKSILTSSSNTIGIIAVHFTPTAIYRLTGTNLYDFTDKIIDAELLFGEKINELYEKIIHTKSIQYAVMLIDSFLCNLLRNRTKQIKPCVALSLSLLKHKINEITIKTLQEVSNTSAKTLERAFKHEIGMTAKTYHRLIRYNKAKLYIEHTKNYNWQELVIRYGFYDQSHLISEFQYFAGMTPKTLLNLHPFSLTEA